MKDVLKSGSAQVPTILIDMVKNPAHQRGILKAALQLDWRIMEARTLSDISNLKLNFAGIISESSHCEAFLEGLIDNGVPAISLSPRERNPDRIYVHRDDVGIAELALGYFRAQSIHSFAFLGHKSGHTSVKRHDAVKERLRESDEFISFFSYEDRIGDIETGDELNHFSSWLNKLPKPVGILGHSDPISTVICRLCLKLGYEIPEDVAILSIGNNEFYCESSPVRLSSIDCADEKQGELAVNILSEIYQGRPYEPRICNVSPAGVIERRSTVPDSLFVRVMWYLQDNLSSPISVSNIADEFKLSRRTIEREFKSRLGHGVNSELVRLRLARCCNLLSSTDLSFHSVAKRSGYSSTNYLQRVFKKEYGIGLKEYRGLYNG